MTIQEQITQDIATIKEHAGLQSQLFDFLQVLKSTGTQHSNKNRILSHAGVIRDDEAQEMQSIIHKEFGKIDGEWQ